MDWDENYGNGYDEISDSLHRDETVMDIPNERRLDPMDITDPTIAYLFLSNDAQEEIKGRDRKKMKCLSCGHRFTGNFYESCPECFSLDIGKMTDGTDEGFW